MSYISVTSYISNKSYITCLIYILNAKYKKYFKPETNFYLVRCLTVPETQIGTRPMKLEQTSSS